MKRGRGRPCIRLLGGIKLHETHRKKLVMSKRAYAASIGMSAATYIRKTAPAPRKQPIEKALVGMLKWLRARLRDSERAEKAAATRHEHGEAQLIRGHVEAYAYTIEHLEKGRW